MTVKLTVVPPAATEPPSIDDSIDCLAQRVATDALADNVAFPDRLDALKALTSYRIGTAKVRGKGGDDDADTPTMGGMKDAIASAGKVI